MYDNDHNRPASKGSIGLLIRTIVPFLLLAALGYAIVSESCTVPSFIEDFFEDSSEISALNCDDSHLIDEIIKLSQQNREENPIHYEIFKIYGTTVVARTDTRLDCSGEALLNISDGADDLYDFRYYVYADRDGDTYIGYDFE